MLIISNSNIAYSLVPRLPCPMMKCSLVYLLVMLTITSNATL